MPTGLVVLLTAACSSFGQDQPSSRAAQPGSAPAGAPLEISFKKFSGKKGEVSCGLPEGRQHVYDPQTGIFHIHFKSQIFDVSAFEITKAAEQFPKPPVFRLTGVPKDYGRCGVPLVLSVGNKRYALEKGARGLGPVDKTLLRVERKDDAVTVEFTAKGQALLKPGAQISFENDPCW